MPYASSSSGDKSCASYWSLEAADKILGRKLVRRSRSDRPAESRTVLLYWLFVSRPQHRSRAPLRRPRRPHRIFRAAATSSAGMAARKSDPCPSRAASSGLPGLMRSPPAWGMRLVGFLQQQRFVRDAPGPPAAPATGRTLPRAPSRHWRPENEAVWPTLRHCCCDTPGSLRS